MTEYLYNSKRRYVGAYMVIECYRNNHIPIISVSVTSVANSAAVASVHVHPNKHLYSLTRGVNIYIVCDIVEAGINSYPVKKVMFIGDMTSIQTTTIRGNTEYVINLTDNRRYLAELPTYYLKLMRSQHDINSGLHMRSDPSGCQSPLPEYTGADAIPSIMDEYADASFYGIEGMYQTENFYYDITDSKVVAMLNSIWAGDGLSSYIRQMTKPMHEATGWEEYYVNMNKKKRITDHMEVFDDGLFIADIKGKFAEAAFQSVKDTHAEMSTTYGDALERLSELGYVFNTNLFPAIVGGQDNKLIIKEDDNPMYKVKSTLFPGELIGIVKRSADNVSPDIPSKDIKYAIRHAKDGNVRYATNVEVYSSRYRDDMYYAIVNIDKDARGRNVNKKPYIAEYAIVPKMYGVIPPKCNWEIIREGVTLNVIESEPPITALKYNLKNGYSGADEFSCSYPGEMEVYAYNPPEPEQEWVPTDNATTVSPVSKTQGGYTFAPEVEAAINKLIAPEHRDIIRVIMYTESRGIPSAKSNKNAQGLMQVHYPSWKNKFDFSRMHEVEYGLWAGYQVFLIALKAARGITRDALWNYNHSTEYVDMVMERLTTLTRGRPAPETLPISPTSDSPEDAPGRTSGYGYYRATSDPAKDGYGERKLLKKEQLKLEEVYGIKRVSTRGSSIYELEKASSYAEESDDPNDMVLTKRQKYDMLKSKVKRDFYESTVSGNTGSVSILGMNEDVVVGFPYIIYYPELTIFYYGFVNEVSHRVDNSSGQAYTEIRLSSLTTTTSIKDIEHRFSGYTKSKYVGGKSGALTMLNDLYHKTVHSENISQPEYEMFDLSNPDNEVKLINTLTSRPGRRSICTLERLQNYFYENQLSVALHEDVAGSLSKRRQWMTTKMHKTIMDIYGEYSGYLTTSINSIILPLDDNNNEQESIGEVHQLIGEEDESAVPAI